MPTANTTNSIQLSAISNLAIHDFPTYNPTDYTIDKNLAYNDLIALGKNGSSEIYLEASIPNADGSYTSTKISLFKLIEAIAKYTKYIDTWNAISDNGYLKVNGETRTWKPSSDVTIQPTNGIPFLVKNNSNNASIEISANDNINIIATNITNDATSSNTIKGNAININAENGTNPVLSITSGKNEKKTNNTISITNYTNNNVIPITVKKNNTDYGEVKCTATKAKWA